MIKYNGFHKIEQFHSLIKGKLRIVEKVGIKSAVGALVMDAEGKIGIVEQFRPCVNERTYEIPAGLMDKEGKSDIMILAEELEEECGIPVNEIEFFLTMPIAEYFMVVGSSEAIMKIYFVKLNTIQTNKMIDDPEVDSVVWLNDIEFDTLMQNINVKDAKTLMAYNWYKENCKLKRY